MLSVNYPINDDGATTPPVCLKSHWDPTAMSRMYILPDALTSVPLSFRPAAQICRQYVTSGPVETLPASLSQLPLRSTVSPPDRYAGAIDNESQLRRLDRPLGTPEAAQYIPSMNSTAPLFSQQLYMPSRISNIHSISELEFPRILMRSDNAPAGYACREAEDSKAIALEKVNIQNGKMFNYSTKYVKYTS